MESSRLKQNRLPEDFLKVQMVSAFSQCIFTGSVDLLEDKRIGTLYERSTMEHAFLKEILGVPLGPLISAQDILLIFRHLTKKDQIMSECLK